MGHDEEAIELNMELNGEEIVEENGNSVKLYEIKSIVQGSLYYKGGCFLYSGFKSEKNNDEGNNKGIIGEVGNVIKEGASSIIQSTLQISGRAINFGVESGNKFVTSYLSKTASRFISAGCIFGSAIIGVAFGGYMTVSYCKELLDRFEDYYKKNANKIANSYDEAKNYFILDFV